MWLQQTLRLVFVTEHLFNGNNEKKYSIFESTCIEKANERDRMREKRTSNEFELRLFDTDLIISFILYQLLHRTRIVFASHSFDDERIR